MSKNQKIWLMVLIAFILFNIFAIIQVSKKTITKTPSEWVEFKHKHDSINITEKTSEFAKNYVNNYLKRKKIYYYTILYHHYDDSIKAYAVRYDFKAKQTSTEVSKTVWIKFHFNCNNGDYIITPEIIKLISYKRE